MDEEKVEPLNSNLREVEGEIQNSNDVGQATNQHQQKRPLKVAIVGAGPAGLCAGRHIFSEETGMTGFIFEQSNSLGGLWVYTDATGKDSRGIPIHSTIYHRLWTNLPKELMFYPDFKYEEKGRSYLEADEVLEYLKKYASQYDLMKHIKLNHCVRRIAPIGKSWSVTVTDLTSNLDLVTIFDAVMVCSGPNIIPLYPHVQGFARFSGSQIHSKEFRRPDPYRGKRVLLIGMGPSGLDIMYKLYHYAKQIILSHNFPKISGDNIPPNVILKPVVVSLEDKIATFEDKTRLEVDAIIYCTGYTYHFPFIDESCGLIFDQYVTPLYKHFINIENPTMCLIGLIKQIPNWLMFEYQVMAFLKVLKGEAKLPSKEKMELELERDIAQRKEEGLRRKNYHKIGRLKSKEYFEELQELANLPPIPDVYFNLYKEAFLNCIKDFKNFRNIAFKILDDDNYMSETLTEPIEFYEKPSEPENPSATTTSETTVEAVVEPVPQVLNNELTVTRGVSEIVVTDDGSIELKPIATVIEETSEISQIVERIETTTNEIVTIKDGLETEERTVEVSAATGETGASSERVTKKTENLDHTVVNIVKDVDFRKKDVE